MTPEERQRLANLEAAIGMLTASDRYTFQKLLQIFDGRNIQLGKTTGTKIGTATDQKLAFWNHAPVTQPTVVAGPLGGATVDTQARTAINALIAWAQGLGLMGT